jgi:DNA-binding XRE family transcriptional regulator
MEQRDKSMGAGASVKAEAVADVVRPARYGVDPDSSVRAERESRAEREARLERVERERDKEVRDRERERERGSKSEREHHHKEAKEEGRSKDKKSSKKNRLRETRIEKMMSKAELARRANLSVLTIDRVEKGLGCRMDTKRKILEALGLSLADRVRVFGEEE